MIHCSRACGPTISDARTVGMFFLLAFVWISSAVPAWSDPAIPAKSASGVDRANWMAEVFNTRSNYLLSDIVIPGTHDTGTYEITLASNYERGSSFTFLDDWRLAPFGVAVDAYIASLSRTQHKTVAQQLQDGIRFLDFRVNVNSNEQFVLVHTMESVKLNNALAEVAAFAAAHPQEIILLEVGKVPSSGYRNAFNSMVHHHLGSYLFPESDLHLAFTSVEDVWNSGRNVIMIVSDNNYASSSPNYWGSSHVQNNWSNTDKPGTLYTDQRAAINPREIGKLTKTSLLMTVQEPSGVEGWIVRILDCLTRINGNPCSTLEMMAGWIENSSRTKIPLWIDQGLRPNIVIVDFYEDTEVVTVAIEENLAKVPHLMGTGWLDRDNPGAAGNHDWEKLHQQFDNGNISHEYYGYEPAYVEMRRISDQVDVSEAFYPIPTYALTTGYGGKVVNTDGNADDYEIQFHYGWTPWLDASTTGDLRNEHKRWTDWADEEVASSVRRRMPTRAPSLSLCRDKNSPHNTVTSNLQSCPGSQPQVRYYFGFEELCKGNYRDAMDNGRCDWTYVSFQQKRIFNGYSASMYYGIDAVGVNPTGNGINIELYQSYDPGGIETWSYDQSDGKIYAGWNSAWCLDVSGGIHDFHNGSNLLLHDCNATSERWDFDPFDGKIRLRGTHYCLDVSGTNGVGNGRNLQIWNCSGVTETWRIDDMDTYSMMAEANEDYCINLAGVNETSNYHSLRMWDCDSPSETWIYLPTTGEFRASWAPHICWDVVGNDPSGTGWSTRHQSAKCSYGYVLEAWDYDLASRQLRLRNHPGLCSGMSGSVFADNARVVQESCSTSERFHLLYD